MKNVEVTKAAVIDQISGKFLRDGGQSLAKPMQSFHDMTLGSVLMLAKSQR